LDTSLLRAIEHETANKEKTPNYGTIRAMGSLGFVITALIAQAIPGFDTSSAATMAIALGILATLFVLSIPTLPEIGATKPRKEKLSFSFTWLDTTYLIGLGVIVLGRMAMASVNSFFSMI